MFIDFKLQVVWYGTSARPDFFYIHVYTKLKSTFSFLQLKFGLIACLMVKL